MGIGTSLGAFFDDEHHYNASLWDPNRFEGDQLMERTPNNVYTDKSLDQAELDPTTGLGIEVGYRDGTPFGGTDEKTYGNIIDRRDSNVVLPDVRDATSMPITARAMEFFGIDSTMFDTNLPPHTGEPLKKDLGYNDIRKPTAKEVEDFRHNVENMNAPADPDMSMQKQEDALGDFIKNLIDPIEKK